MKWSFTVGELGVAIGELFVLTDFSDSTGIDGAAVSLLNAGSIAGDPGKWSAVPEPSTITLWSLSGLLLSVWHWQRRRRRTAA